MIFKGIDLTTHDDTIKILSLDFVKTGLIPKEIFKILKRLLSLKTEVDYGDMVTVEEHDAQEALKDAEKFLNEIFALREKLINELKILNNRMLFLHKQ